VSVEEALVELKAILGNGLYPTAVPKVREVLIRLRDGDALRRQDLLYLERSEDSMSKNRPS
jgi:hypothetical protein